VKITVIGCGRWGSFLAWYMKTLGNSVTLYGRSGSRSYEELKSTRKNEYLTLQDDIEFSCDLTYSLESADTVIISIGAQSLPALAESIRNATPKASSLEYLLCMKGIVEDGGQRLSEVMENALGKDVRCAVWLGPGHVEDFTNGVPNCMIMCSRDASYAEELCSRFGSSLIRFYYSDDLIGCELGAATKNVMGIAAGILDGMGYTSLKGALIARGPREIARLALAMGGSERSIFGLCHIGDYEATLFSAHSHNRRFGEAFIKNEPYDKLAEGVYTVKSVLYLGKKYGVELPVCEAVNDIIHGGKNAEDTLTQLFLRSQKSEF
jgi:glycerol-3-phosphate dehydrogenase (NAD(P)+)